MNAPDKGLTMENKAPNASRKVVTQDPGKSVTGHDRRFAACDHVLAAGVPAA
jgi:hypothetical protein